MKASISSKLEHLVARHQEIAALLADPETIGDQDRFRTLSMEYAQNQPVVRQFEAYQQAESERAQALEMMEDGDDELSAMAREEVQQCEQTLQSLEGELQRMLLPQDP
ncbi:MAG: PCRF domain-containing protein, partial [Gammaproteobacteria bacterium]|nr:PCRF domain-containing protein [Gammaproteobacteria bacterium]